MTSQPSPGLQNHWPREHDAEFDTLYGRLSAPLRRFFRRSGCTAEESSDLAHDTLLRAYKGLDAFRHEASEKTWVLRIAARVLANHWRARSTVKRKAHVVPFDAAAELDAPTPAHEDPQKVLLDGEARDLIAKALETLPPQMRRCMLLYVTQDRKYREIAVILRISVGAVKSQIHEARTQLRAQLGDHFGLGKR